ncbi:MAG: hypothetical protein ACREQ5_04315 [Candidatus Dormibacteria bacterium]
MLKEAPKDEEGIQRALVNVKDDTVDIQYSTDSDYTTASAFYGLQPMAVAKLNNPFPLIPKRSLPEEENQIRQFNRNLLRQALRRIVEEV